MFGRIDVDVDVDVRAFLITTPDRPESTLYDIADRPEKPHYNFFFVLFHGAGSLIFLLHVHVVISLFFSHAVITLGGCINTTCIRFICGGGPGPFSRSVECAGGGGGCILNYMYSNVGFANRVLLLGVQIQTSELIRISACFVIRRVLALGVVWNGWRRFSIW